ncbi:hypothetical protein NDU88_005134 [Pleurodeles waltl]|uniref:Uncharacterized protein n=1 Tax=Pleurodeles waltl TaxID=8319 RepID=A0AAV7TW94_PLEWA|nr:hypothetical protein NDU88_005134 [Pleurodeles waltl]
MVPTLHNEQLRLQLAALLDTVATKWWHSTMSSMADGWSVGARSGKGSTLESILLDVYQPSVRMNTLERKVKSLEARAEDSEN